MTLQEIAYYILEPVKSFNIVDDEEIDIRMVKAWIKAKRADILKNKANSGQDINLNNAQSITYGLELKDTYTGTKSTTVYNCENGQDYSIYKSTEPLPNLLHYHGSPLVLELTSEDKMHLPYSMVPFSQLRFSGNGRFTSSMIYGSIDVDKYVYFKVNDEFLTRPNFVIKGIFEDPTAVPGFDEENDQYPCSLDVIEAIKNSVFDKDFKILLASSVLEDTENSANDEG